MTLSNSQINQYQIEGYTLLGRVLSDAQLEGLRASEAQFRAAKGGQDARTFFPTPHPTQKWCVKSSRAALMWRQ